MQCKQEYTESPREHYRKVHKVTKGKILQVKMKVSKL
jgi:hypothetical protein